MNYEVSKHVVSASHVHNRGIVDSNLHHYCITSELMISSAEKRVGSEMKMPFEEYAELIDVSPFVQGNKTVVDIRLHSCLLEEAFRNGKASSTS